LGISRRGDFCSTLQLWPNEELEMVLEFLSLVGYDSYDSWKLYASYNC
jgi:hypothetical protein